MRLQQEIYQRAKEANATIILAEADDPRILEATKIIISERLAKIILVGQRSRIRESLGEERDEMRIIDPASDITEEMVFALQQCKGFETVDTTQTKKILSEDTKTLSAIITKIGMADGYVAGNLCATAETIRPAIKIIGTTNGFASSYFLMIKEDQVLVFADCAFNIDPNPEQLARIAIDTATSAKEFGIKPSIAFLSFSTKGSAKHEQVEKVQKAVEIATTLSDFPIDGEMQFDTAIDAEVGKQKAPQSPVAGHANILVFPDLNSGNIGYKIAQRLGGYSAIGPIMQGFRKPVNDLSRGCSIQDIIDVVAVTAMQTGKKVSAITK